MSRETKFALYVVLMLLGIGVCIDGSITEREVTHSYHDTWHDAKDAQRECITDVPDDVTASARVMGPTHGMFTVVCTRIRREL